jgi:DNA repair protein SbcC/Rad50
LIVRSIVLRNIRSYNDGEETSIAFPEGVVLLEGDVGSGKSSILYALEFALFGFSDMKGEHLLSEGKSDGRVAVTMEVEGRTYKVERRLKRKGDAVEQEECSIFGDDGKERLSPSDLKERVVSILGFNEPTHPRAESLVYRYAVFTPQEQMKEILVDKPEERLHVVRRVLGAQGYQTASESSMTLERRLDKISYALKKASDDLEQKQEEHRNRLREAAELEEAIPALRKKEEESSRTIGELEERQKALSAERDALRDAASRASMIERELAEAEKGVAKDEAQRAKVRARSESAGRAVAKFESLRAPEASREDLEMDVDEARERLASLRATRAALSAEVERRRALMNAGVCPVCGQRLSDEFSQRSHHMEDESRSLDGGVAAQEQELLSLSKKRDAARAFEEAQKEGAAALSQKAEAEEELASLDLRLHESELKKSKYREELEGARAVLKGKEEVERKAEELGRELAAARDSQKKAIMELSLAAKGLEDAKSLAEGFSREVEKKKRERDESGKMQSYAVWLAEYFRPSIRLIEERTLAQAASRFNEHFKRYFGSLVDDTDMEVGIRENFTPVFERGGVEQDFEALSGGERTSMALAYRFSLNSVVREGLSGKTELVILDEPTDGFSKEQVFRMRSLLDVLESRQVILVSHEKELESMADHVVRVEKRNGSSYVSA